MSDEADVDTKQAAAVTGVAARNHDELRKDILASAGIFLFAFALYLLPAVLSRPLSETPETRVAVVAREMVASHNYVLPTLGGTPRLNKPPLPYWLAAGSAQLLSGKDGPTQRTMTNATLLPPAVVSAGALFLVAFYGCTVFGRAAGMIAGLVLGLGMLVTRFGQLGFGDATLMFCCAWMFCSAAWIVTMPRPGFMAALELGVSLGLAILTKGHIPVLLLLGPVLVEAAIRRRFNGRKVALFAISFVIAAGSLWWFFAVKALDPTAWDTMISEAKQALGSTAHDQNDRWTYYFYQLAGALLPWTPLLALAWGLYFFQPKKKGADEASGIVASARENMRFFLLTFVIGFIGFYAAVKQQPQYLLPILPPLALASGYMLAQFRFPGGMSEEKLAWAQLALGILIGIGIALFPLWPLEQLSQTKGSAESLKALAASPGWLASIPIGLLCIGIHFFCARQWVEGRPLAAVGGIAVAAYLGLGVCSVYWAKKTQQVTVLASDAKRLRAKLDGFGKDVRLYGVGMSESDLIFYLERPVKEERDLAKEPVGEVGNTAPMRAIILRTKHIPLAEKEYGLTISDDVRESKDPILVLPLPSDRDWPKEVGPAILARKSKEH